MQDSSEFAEQVVIVTGAAKGQGRATAEIFAQAGAQVIIVDIDSDGAELTRKDIASGSGRAASRVLDVADSKGVADLVHSVHAEYGRIDAVINNAGITIFKSISETSEEEWDRVLDVNLKSMFLMSKVVIPIMQERQSGSIVNIASAMGLKGSPNHSAYCASKGGVVNFTRALALEVARDNIRVNCICPGAVNTPMLQSVFDSDPARLAAVRDRVPIGRIAGPEEIGRVSLFLCSAQSSFMTGAVMSVDGGDTSR